MSGVEDGARQLDGTVQAQKRTGGEMEREGGCARARKQSPDRGRRGAAHYDDDSILEGGA